MKTYKFRARDLNGKLVYGGITADGDFIIANARKFVTVYKDSIRQHVGYDCDGREIYEHDIVLDGDGNEYIAELYPNARDVITNVDVFLLTPKDTRFALKE